VVRAAGIFPGLTQVLGQLIAGAQRAAIGELLINRRHASEEIGSRAGLHLENIDTGRDVLVEEIGLGKAQIDLLRAKRDNRSDADILAAAEEVALADTDVGERAVGRRETEAEGQFTGRLFLDLGADHGAVRRRARAVVDLDLLEETEI